jgi:hypothetical protein
MGGVTGDAGAGGASGAATSDAGAAASTVIPDCRIDASGAVVMPPA